MKRWTINLVCCPVCRGKLDLQEGQAQDSEIIGGSLICRACRKTFIIERGLPRMVIDTVRKKDLARNWGYQWAKVSEGQLETETYYGATEDEAVRFFFKVMAISEADLPGKKVLDAGCGPAQHIRALGKYGAQFIGIDIATSIDRIHDYCRTEPGVDIIQADLENPPFPDGSFDYVISKNSLCYVSQPEVSFKFLAGLVKPGGRLAVCLPDNANPAFITRLKDFLRFTDHVPLWLLFYVCMTLAPFAWAGTRLGGKRRTSLRTNFFLLFNGLHTRFSRHTAGEVVAWFNRTGFTQIKDLTKTHSVVVRGTKAVPDSLPGSQ